MRRFGGAVILGAPTLVRRSRGYVPRPVAVATKFDPPVLALGAQLKNCFCLGVGHDAWMGPHIGDLDDPDTFDAYQEAIANMERLAGVRAEILAHDLHPDYLSTRYAHQRSAGTRIAVQHHHAHVASAMAKHKLAGPVLGLAFDGSGLGLDGTLWGGELLLAEFAGFERIASFRPLPLAGGERAIREVWRLALALLDDAFGPGCELPSRLELFKPLPARSLAGVRSMLAKRLNTPAASGVGRYFDAIGALLLAAPHAAYEGQVALMLTDAADPRETAAYDFALDCSTRGTQPWSLDLRPMVRSLVDNLIAGVERDRLAARFHNTLIAAAAAMVRVALRHYGPMPVVLSGGCFQNPRLAQGLAAELGQLTTVHLHRSVPPGDGGIALGQAMVAAALVKGQ